MPGNKTISKERITNLRISLLKWFKKNERHFPWRNTSDPYRILMAEFMLRRTRAEQVVPVYHKLISRFPTVKQLAQADLRELQRILKPLGLRWRVPAFRQVARVIIQSYARKVPDTRNELLELPGVGDYVAGAVLSTAFRKREWIVDSNVVRVYLRNFGMEKKGEGRRDNQIIQIAKQYSNSRKPQEANLAILDFAALICMPRNPKCTICPLRNYCLFYLNKIN